MFANKYVDGINNDGTSTVRYNYYVERNSIQYSTNRNQNARIYHITITRTSNDYVLAVPDMDQNNFTSDDKDNQQKVSPSFMIASRLGLINNMGNKKVDYEWAQNIVSNMWKWLPMQKDKSNICRLASTDSERIGNYCQISDK